MEIKKLDERADFFYATSGSAGADLRACSAHGERLEDGVEVIIPSGQTVMVGTGIALDLGSVSDTEDIGTKGELTFAAMVMPRSGLGCKQGLVPGNLVGLIDADYQGEIKVCLWNRGSEAQTIRALDRIAQLVIVPVFKPFFRVVEEFSRITDRAEGGFGSSGK